MATVAASVLRNSKHQVHVFGVDAIRANGRLQWSIGDGARPAALTDASQRPVRLDALDVIWWRRVSAPQILRDGEQADLLVDAQWRAALRGLVLAELRGIVVNEAVAAIAAENKLLQLHHAAAVGLGVPETLVTQDPDALADFRAAHRRSGVVAKLLAPALDKGTQTVDITRTPLESRLVRSAPSIYQRRVDGTRHLRVHCFGAHVHAALIESEILDWRVDLSPGFERVDLDPDLRGRLLELNRRLGLSLAVHDLKVDERGNTWYLETNQQGQFAFVEGLGGGDLMQACSRFFIELADSARRHDADSARC